jgi:uncharacterized protein YdcH (DUF465 family)
VFYLQHSPLINNVHFAKLIKQYHKLDHEVWRVGNGVENTRDVYLEKLKLQRLNLKDNQ